MKRTDSERLEAMETELSDLRSQNKELSQLVVSFSPESEVTPVAQVINDRSRVGGLRDDLVPFWAARHSVHPSHPHTEAYAMQIGYRAAMAGDFEDRDGRTAKEWLDLAAKGQSDLVLFVCGRAHHRRRTREHAQRSAIAASAPLPTFRGPDGVDATVKE